MSEAPSALRARQQGRQWQPRAAAGRARKRSGVMESRSQQSQIIQGRRLLEGVRAKLQERRNPIKISGWKASHARAGDGRVRFSVSEAQGAEGPAPPGSSSSGSAPQKETEMSIRSLDSGKGDKGPGRMACCSRLHSSSHARGEPRAGPSEASPCSAAQRSSRPP